jgi:hypothetical protein
MDNIEKQIHEIEENLHKWFKEKWVRFGPDGKIRGQCAREKSSEGKPKCRPLKSAQAMGKKARATAARRKRREDPNPDRSGKAKNVKTEETIMENHICPICGGELVSEALMNEKKDACYYKVKARYKVWPSAYASGALVKCRKSKGKWGSKSEGVEEATQELDEKWSEKYKRSIDCSHPKGFSQRAHCQGRKKTEEQLMKEEQLRKLIREMVEEEYATSGKDYIVQQMRSALRKVMDIGGRNIADVEVSSINGRVQFILNTNGVSDVTDAYITAKDETLDKFNLRMSLRNGENVEKENLSKRDVIKTLRSWTGQLHEDVDECWECYESVMEEGTNEAWEECYRKTNWDMIPEGDEHTCEGDEFYEIYGDMNADAPLEEAEYRGRKVPLGKPMRGDVKKFKVYVKNPKTGNVKKVNFGDKKMRIKKSNPKRRKSFRARHRCSNPGPRTSARYWSCRKW